MSLLISIAQAGIRLIPFSLRARLALECVTIETGLGLLNSNGFKPSAIIDVGACEGNWSRLASVIWPGIPVYMIDGNPESERPLGEAARQIGATAKYYIRLLGQEHRDSMRLFQLGRGTSVLKELTVHQPKTIEVPMDRLDSLLKGEFMGENALVKLDVQGYELEVLKGAGEIFRRAEVVIVEAALLPFNDGAPLFAEVVSFMDAAGFATYEICGASRRTDQAQFQVDVFFVRRESNLRRKQRFFKSEATVSGGTGQPTSAHQTEMRRGRQLGTSRLHAKAFQGS
jgi:FkbM family methyltransferase